MAGYSNYNNNSRERDDSTNTRGRQYYNSDGTHKSTLVLGFWNKMVSLKLHPALPTEKITQNEKFDYEQVISTALSNEKALKLSELITEIIIPSIKEGVTVVKGVPIGVDSGIFVGVNEDDNGHYGFLTIAKNLDSETKLPKEAMTYQFNKNLTIEHYDITNGDFEVGSDNVLEIKEFAIQLMSAVQSLVGAQAHAMRHIDKYYRDRLSEAVGVKKGSSAPYNGGGSTGSVFGSSRSNDTSKSNTSTDIDRSKLDNVEQMSSFTDMV